MRISDTLRSYLLNHGVDFELIRHAHSACSGETARSAHIPGDQLAKGVMLEDDKGFLLAVLPSSHYVELGLLRRQTQRPNLHLATEDEFADLFEDCEPGALPPIGEAYGLRVVCDDSLAAFPDIYLESGNHDDVVRISGSDFRRLMRNASHGYFSRRSNTH